VRPGPVHKRRDGQHPAGDFAEGRQVARDALRRPGIARRAELAALIVDTLGQSLSLDLENFEGILARGLDLAEELHAEEPLATDQLLLATAEVRCYQDPAAVLALAVERGRPDSPLLGTWRMVTSMVTLMTGDITTAVVASHEALLLMERSDPFANLSMVGSVHGVALAQSGSTDPLGDLRTDLTISQARREPRARVWTDRAQAWNAVRSDPPRAIAIAKTGGRRAVCDGNVGWACDLLHDAVRFVRCDRSAAARSGGIRAGGSCSVAPGGRQGGCPRSGVGSGPRQPLPGGGNACAPRHRAARAPAPATGYRRSRGRGAIESGHRR
jgi:hypothetical protein